MLKITKKLLGEILLEDGLITKEQLNEALATQAHSKVKKPLGELLIELGYLQEEGLALSLARKLGIKFVSFSDNSLKIKFDQGLDKLISEKFARAHYILPISKTERYLSVAMWDPLDFVAIDNIKRMTGLEPITYCSTKKDVLAGIDRLYLQKGVIAGETALPDLSERIKFSVENIDELKLKAAEAPVVRTVNSLIQEAVREKASDIHIEPLEAGVSIRYRIDGILYEVEPPQTGMIVPMISRIKILSRLDIAEKRLPQDGGFMMKVGDKSIDLRVSTIPTIYGEKVALRVLDKDTMRFDLPSIGLSADDFEKVSSNIKKPYGLIFLTGPTGSGKTTTLYCILNAIKSSQKNIVTIEDPVEYRIDGVNQVQAMPAIGLDFAKGLRAFLRQDPDVIMVGEVRDLETAEICVRSALVGRLVLSTLHTNDSVGAISRLLDFGIEPFLLSSTVNMVIAQRLVRKLCPDCKQPVSLDAKTLDMYRLKDVTVYGPKGCQSCRNRGFTGRIALFEIMSVDKDMQAMIEKRDDIGSIKKALIKKNMKTLREDGLDKVRKGHTSLDEVLAATIDVA